MKGLIFTLILCCYAIIGNGQDECKSTTFKFNELDPTLDIDNKKLTFVSFDCLSCEYTPDDLEICKCRKTCGTDEDCLKKCGEMPMKFRTRKGFRVRIETWYSTDLLNTIPPMTEPNESWESDTSSGSPENCYSYTFSGDFSLYKSLCVKTNVVIVYEDGTCCVYQDRKCFNLN